MRDLKDELKRRKAADAIGIQGIFVHALSAEVQNLYMRIVFALSFLDPMMLTITWTDLKASLGETGLL